ncbi:hypothetical protein [Stenotrophomonas sp. AB1(2024)]|uniref:hypothetical protein n=1 Tax=Stenotrophomonas sp. AB1(2024) TaxID=3132215 RepID=UPI00309E011B
MAADDKLVPGSILLANQFYADVANGQLLPKYLLVLARAKRSDDIVWRLLTSRCHGRPEAPPCFHGDPYPGFFLSVINPEAGLGKKTWLDLRALDDGDAYEVRTDLAAGKLQYVCAIGPAQLRLASLCAAAADDTTTEQETSIRDQLAR